MARRSGAGLPTLGGITMGKVLLVMGHRNDDPQGGDDSEIQRTVLVVNAVEKALASNGHSVHVLQKEDDDGDATWAHGWDLSAIGARCSQIIREKQIDVMIDAHFQGSDDSATGCFCI